MKLTRFQYKALKIYSRLHEHDFALSQVLRTYSPAWALFAGFALLAYLLVVPLAPGLGYLFAGLFVGAIARDVAQLQVARRLWPVNREIYDWQKVEALIQEHEKGTRPDGTPNDGNPDKIRWRRLIIIWLVIFFGIILLMIIKDRMNSD